MMVIWETQTGKPLYGQPNRDIVQQIKFFNKTEDKLIAITQHGV